MREHSQYPEKAGIYKLTCKDTGLIYIGKSVNIKSRLIAHKYCENRDKGRCYFENVIRKYGWESFEVGILEIFKDFDKTKKEDNDKLLERETYYIRLLESTNRNKGYNICEISNDRTGTLVSEETKEKIRNARLGMKFSDETKEKMRKRRHTKKAKEKMRSVKLGNSHSDETKDKMRDAKLGIPKSEEHKANMRKSKSSSHRENIRLSWIKRKQEKQINQEQCVI